jgi:hypothetical protein
LLWTLALIAPNGLFRPLLGLENLVQPIPDSAPTL